jgi:hypothetical protein
MINILLNTLFNKDIYFINIKKDYIHIYLYSYLNKNFIKKKLHIYILSNDLYKKYSDSLIKRKNCLIIKGSEITFIYLNINFIKSIIRNKLLTNILNNV